MNEKQNRIAKNIRDLRKAYNETGEELAFAIGVGKSAISNYEKGRNIPQKDVLKKIARHYRITEEDLVTGDFEGIHFVGLLNNEIAMKEVGAKMFPIVTSRKAEEDVSFNKAYHLHKKLFNDLENDSFCEIDFGECFDYYADSIEQNKTPESAGNLIGIIILAALSISEEALFEKYNSVKKKNGEMKDILKTSWLKDCDDEFVQDDENLNEAKEFIKEVEDYLYKLILLVKSSKRLYPLADYYIALMYLLRLVNNDKSEEINNVIGEEMMDLQLKLKNPYAIQYIGSLINLNQEN